MVLFAMEAAVWFDALLPLVIGVLLFSVWFVAGRFFSVWPTGRAIPLVLVPLILSLLYFVFDVREEFGMVFLFDAIFALVLLIDFFTVATGIRFTATRQTDQIASLSKTHSVELEVRNRSRFGQVVEISEDGSSALFGETSHTFSRRFIDHNQGEKLDYQFKPIRRGSFTLEAVYVGIFSRLGFWKKLIRIPCVSRIDVYPDLQQIGEYEILARQQRLHLLGVRRVRRIGNDNDFERLRDYTLDDQYKFIDWKSTARRNKLTVKDFQMNRNQRVVFMIDAGRMMTNRANDISLLDHSLNAMLMLGYIALKQGDEVGFICFADSVLQSIPARAGMSQMNHLIHGGFNLFPMPVESRYDLAFNELRNRSRKRSLVILMTNILDSRNSTRIESHLTRLVGRHLPLGVFLRDHATFEPVQGYIRALDFRNEEEYETSESGGELRHPLVMPHRGDLFRAAASAEILNWRRLVLKRLSAKGTLTLDLFPEQMTAPLINKYLEIKARHLL